MKILVVEDEPDLNRIIVKHLQAEGYLVDSCFNGNDAVYYITEENYDAVLLDAMLPGKDGFQVLKDIRSKRIETPVMFLTARDQTEDIVAGLDCGADDYVVKPFSFDEVLARLRVIIKRSPKEHGASYQCNDLIVDTDKKSVTRQGIPIELSPKEYSILEYMIRNKNIALSRSQIESNAWGIDFDGESNIIDVYIRYLRKKIDDDFDIKLIQTVRGIGYMLEDVQQSAHIKLTLKLPRLKDWIYARGYPMIYVH